MTDSDSVDVASYLRAADEVKAAPGGLREVTAFAKVVVAPDGDRYGVIDLRAPDAPTGLLEIDARLFDEMELRAIRVVAKNVGSGGPRGRRP